MLLIAILIAGGCDARRAARPGVGLAMDELVLLTRYGCANTAILRRNVDLALRSMGLEVNYRVVDLDAVSEADGRRGYPTPALVYANRDVFGMAQPQPPFPNPT
jgi:hypothetical protein